MGWPAVVAAAAPAVISGLSSIMNTGSANEASRTAATEAYYRNVHSYNHRYQWAVDDMRKAGLNPILAASSGMNVGSAPEAPMRTTFAAPPMPSFDIGSNAKNLAQEKTETQKQELTKNQALTELERIHQVRAQTKLVNQQEFKTFNEIQNLAGQFDKIQAEIKNIEQTTNTAKAQMEKVEQEKANLIKVGQMLSSQLKQLQNISKVYGSGTGKIMTWINEILNSLNLKLSGPKIYGNFGK